MAIASSHASIIGRSGGRCSVAAAAYRSGEKLHDERTGNTYDYSRKRNIAYSEILTPSNAPDWAKDRSKLWNAVEKAEKRCDAQTAREIRIALPKELTLQQNIDALRDYAQTFTKQGMVVDFALHNDKGNPHAHIMLTTRSIDETGFGLKVRDWNKPEKVEEWRKTYEHIVNRHLEKAGCPERICMDSYEKQGIDKIPTIHLGHASHEKEQQGIATIRGNTNREIEARNSQIEEHNLDIGDIEYLLEKERKALALDEKYRRAEERYQKPRTLTPEPIDNRDTTYKKHTPEELDRLYKEAERRHANKPKEHHERQRRERQREDEKGLER